MENGNGITKADLAEAATHVKNDIMAVLERFGSNIIAAFRSYDADPKKPPAE